MSSSASNRDKISSSNRQNAFPQSDKPWLNLKYHKNGTIMTPNELEGYMEEPERKHVNEEILDRVQGSMLGTALGDAVGARVEFRPQDFLAKNPVKDLKGGGTWGLKTGQFTDDTSMALCLANSLVVCKDFIPYDQLVRYKWWYKYGYMSSTGKCFDIGTATRQSLHEFERRQEEFSNTYQISLNTMDYLSNPELLSKFNVYCSEKEVAGNGALMRLAPVPLFFYRYPECAVEFSGISGQITHGDQIAYDACRYYGALTIAALHGETKTQLLEKSFYSVHEHWFNNKQLHPDIMEIAQGSFKKSGGHSAGIRGKGYIVSALEAALWAFWSDNDSFETGVLAAVNLGDDTDTTAAIYGQLAGAYYGYKKLPSKWLQLAYAQNFIQCLSAWIVYEGNRWKPEESRAATTAIPTLQAHPKTTDNPSSKQNSNSNKHKPPTQSNSQQGFGKFPKGNERSRSKAQPAHQLIPEKDQSKRSTSSTRPALSNTNHNNATRASQSSFKVKSYSNSESASSKPTSSTDPNAVHSKVLKPTSRKTLRFD